jgi:hypothetical protein
METYQNMYLDKCVGHMFSLHLQHVVEFHIARVSGNGLSILDKCRGRALEYMMEHLI